jgi:Restriction endonuclease
MADWKGFERLAERIARDVAPNATVTWDDHLYGHTSETDRQIDVSIRWSEGGQDYLTVVQAKDWRRPADIKAVGEFASVVEDVHATRGVLVCSSGFSQTAKTYARNKGIALYNLHDAESRDWNLDLTIPLLWLDLHPRLRFSCLNHFDAGESLLLFDGLPALSANPAGKNRVKLFSTFERLWNARAIPQTIGGLHTLTSREPVFVLIEDTSGTRQWRPTEFEVVYEVDCQAWLGQFTPAECRGVVDHLDGDVFLPSYLPIGQIPAVRDERWVEIDDPDGVVLNTRGALVTTIGYEIVPGSAQVGDVDLALIQPDEPGHGRRE